MVTSSNNFLASALIFPAILNFGKRIGVKPEDFLACFSVPFELSQIESATITEDDFRNLLALAVKSSNTPAPGLLFGKTFSFDFLPELKIFVESGRNASLMAPIIVSFVNAVVPFLRAVCVSDAKETSIYITAMIDLEDDERAVLVESAISLLIYVFSLSSDELYRPLSVSFSHSLQSGLEVYRAEMPCQVFAGSLVNCFKFHSSPLNDDVNELPSDDFYTQARDISIDKIRKLNARNSFPAMVESVIGESMRPSQVSLSDVSQELGLRERALQRRLKSHGVSFRAIHDRALFHVVVELIKGKSLTIEEIAKNIGFSSRRGLVRLTRRVSGVSPVQLRQEILSASKKR